jgi:signal transduction histidine kinase
VLFDADEKQLAGRVICMVAIVVAANLMTRLERERRRERRWRRSAPAWRRITQLQRRAQEAEREVQRERIRISQEIHDRAAQSAYVLSLGLETCLQMTCESNVTLQERLRAFHAQSRHALWELRYPMNLGQIFDGKRRARIM